MIIALFLFQLMPSLFWNVRAPQALPTHIFSQPSPHMLPYRYQGPQVPGTTPQSLCLSLSYCPPMAKRSLLLGRLFSHIYLARSNLPSRSTSILLGPHVGSGRITHHLPHTSHDQHRQCTPRSLQLWNNESGPWTWV